MNNQSLALPLSNLSPWPVRPLPSPTDFPAYARACNEQPFLSEDDERDLVARLRQDADRDAAWRLIVSHLRLVVRVVRAHAGYGLPLGDLAQEGTVGLMKAVRRFDPVHGVRLGAYAVRWVEAEIREYIFRNWRMVRLTATSALRRLFFSYRKTVEALRGWGDERPPLVSLKAIAAELNVSEADVKSAEAYFRGTDEGFDFPDLSGDFRESSPVEERQLTVAPGWSSSSVDPAEAFEAESEENHRRELLTHAFSKMPERERLVLTARRLQSPPEGLKELGQRLGVSAERVRQIEVRAWARLGTLLPLPQLPM